MLSSSSVVLQIHQTKIIDCVVTLPMSPSARLGTAGKGLLHYSRRRRGDIYTPDSF